MFKFEVVLFNSNREKNKVIVDAINQHKAMLKGEKEYGRRGWHAEEAKRIDYV